MTYGLDVGRHPRLEHVRPVPAPREAHPAVRHERHRRRAAAAVRRRPAAARLAVRRRPRRRRRLRPAPRRGAARPTTCPAAPSWPNREVVDAAPRAARQAVVAGPAACDDRPGHDRRYAMDGAKLAALGWRAGVGLRGGPRPRRSTGIATNEAWWRRRRDRATGTPTTSASTADRLAALDARPGQRMRVAVTGASGRLGGALVDRPRGCAVHRPAGPIAWTRPDFDLDAPERRSTRSSSATGRRSSSTPPPGPTSTAAPATRSSPIRRNAERDRASLAEACAARGIDLLVVSTNEVFDGAPDRRPRLRAGRPDRARSTRTAPRRPAGERAGAATRSGTRPGASGSSGRPGCTARPATTSRPRSSAAADRAAAAGEPLRVVADELGSPTYAADLADAIVELLGRGRRRGHPPPRQRRRRVARRLGARGPRPGRPSTCRSRRSRPRPGRAPRRRRAWAVLAPTPLPSGEPMRPWPQAHGRLPPTLARALAGRRDDRLDRAARPRRCRASATAPSPASPTSAARSASCGGARPARSTRPMPVRRTTSSRASSRPTCRRRRPASCAACTSTGASSTTGSSPTGRAFVALVDVRPDARRPERPRPSSRRASSRPTTGSSSRPASPTASWPSSRSSSSTS